MGGKAEKYTVQDAKNDLQNQARSLLTKQQGEFYDITKENIDNDEYKNAGLESVNTNKDKEELWKEFSFFTKLLLVCRSLFLIPRKGSIAGNWVDEKLKEHGCTMTEHSRFGRHQIHDNYTTIKSQIGNPLRLHLTPSLLSQKSNKTENNEKNSTVSRP